jgi:type II secretory pathway component GspD/PulD (secretin)
VGITLEITPQITSDDSVRLEIKQEISDIIATAGLNPNVVGPSTSKRTADTTVIVKDRQTMVIGGLIRDNLVSSTSKVPLLGDIPILGWLFKFKTSKIEKTNLMIFITPYIIKTEADATELTNRKNDTLDQFRKEYRIEKKGGEPNLRSQPAEKSGIPQKKEAPAALQTAPTTTAEKKETGAALRSGPTATVEKKDGGAPLKSGPTTSLPAPKESVR